MTQKALDRTGQTATVEGTADGSVRVRLSDGVLLDLPASVVRQDEDGSYRADVVFSELKGHVLEEVEEDIEVRKVTRETGRVVARTFTETHDVPVDADGWRDVVSVERVPIDREVEAVAPPREEGDVTVIPVYEEVLVVRKQLVLREEVRLVRRREPVQGPESVSLRRQRVEIERSTPSDGTGASTGASPSEGM